MEAVAIDPALFGSPEAPAIRGVERTITEVHAPTAEVSAAASSFEFSIPAAPGLIDLYNLELQMNLAISAKAPDPAPPAAPSPAGQDITPEMVPSFCLEPGFVDAWIARCEVTANGRALDDQGDGADSMFAAFCRRALFGSPGDLDLEAATCALAAADVAPGNGIVGAQGAAVAIDFQPTTLTGAASTAINNVNDLITFYRTRVFGLSTDTAATWNGQKTLLNGWAYRLLQNVSAEKAAAWLGRTSIMWRKRFDFDAVTAPASRSADDAKKAFNSAFENGMLSLISLLKDPTGFPADVPNDMKFATSVYAAGTLPDPAADPIDNTDNFANAFADIETQLNEWSNTLILHATRSGGNATLRAGGMAIYGRAATGALVSVPAEGALPSPANTAHQVGSDIPALPIGGAGINFNVPTAGANAAARNRLGMYHGSAAAGGSRIPLTVFYKPQHVLFSGGMHSRYLPSETNLRIRITLTQRAQRLFRMHQSDLSTVSIGFLSASEAPGFQPQLIATRVFVTTSMAAELALSMAKRGHRLLCVRSRTQSFDLMSSTAGPARTTATNLCSGSAPRVICVMATPYAAYDGDTALSPLGTGPAARLASYDEHDNYAKFAPVASVTFCEVQWGGVPCTQLVRQDSEKDQMQAELYARYRRMCQNGPVLSPGQFANSTIMCFQPAAGYPPSGPYSSTMSAPDLAASSSAMVTIEVGRIGYGQAPPNKADADGQPNGPARSQAYRVVVIAFSDEEIQCDASRTYTRSW